MSNCGQGVRKLVYNTRTKEYHAMSKTMYSILTYLDSCIGKKSSYTMICAQTQVTEQTMRVVAQRFEGCGIAERYGIKKGKSIQGHLKLTGDIVLLGDVKSVSWRVDDNE